MSSVSKEVYKPNPADHKSQIGLASKAGASEKAGPDCVGHTDFGSCANSANRQGGKRCRAAHLGHFPGKASDQKRKQHEMTGPGHNECPAFLSGRNGPILL